MEQEQIIALYRSGESIDKIANQLGIHRETVSEYVKAAGFKVKRGRPRKTGNLVLRVPTGFESKATISTLECPPGLDPPGTSISSLSKCAAYHEFILERLARGMDAYYIWYDLKEERGFDSTSGDGEVPTALAVLFEAVPLSEELPQGGVEVLLRSLG